MSRVQVPDDLLRWQQGIEDRMRDILADQGERSGSIVSGGLHTIWIDDAGVAGTGRGQPKKEEIRGTFDFTNISFPNPNGVGSFGPEALAMYANGFVNFPKNETYTIYVTSDDGIILTIEGTFKVGNYGGPITTSFTFAPLFAGFRAAWKMVWQNNTGPSQLKLEWSSATTPRQVIPASAFSYELPLWTPIMGNQTTWPENYGAGFVNGWYSNGEFWIPMIRARGGFCELTGLIRAGTIDQVALWLPTWARGTSNFHIPISGGGSAKGQIRYMGGNLLVRETNVNEWVDLSVVRFPIPPQSGGLRP